VLLLLLLPVSLPNQDVVCLPLAAALSCAWQTATTDSIRKAQTGRCHDWHIK
jgi:hypothetical protein